MPGKPLTAEQNECVRAHLRDLLKMRNGSQSEVARELGVSQPTISSVLSGRQGAGYYLVERIAKALGRDEREVLGKMPGRGPALPKAGRDGAPARRP
jgi:transcriptional regulator with XRE-family HTH domain